MVKSKPYRDLEKLDRDDRITAVVEDFVDVVFNRIRNINANELIKENGINPLLIWALGITDFKSLAQYSVHQRLGRSIVTSFGQKVVEEIVRGAMGVKKDKKGDWWVGIKESQN